LTHAEQSRLHLLSAVESKYKFFSYDTRNPEFFRNKDSDYLQEYRRNMDSCISRLDLATRIWDREMASIVESQQAELRRVDSLFLNLVNLVHERGFKDDQLVGRMREAAHWLEGQVPDIPRSDVLLLRRHEKDFIIRNDTAYVNEFSRQVGIIRSRLDRQISLDAARKSELRQGLDRYQAAFYDLQRMDRLLGIKDNTGLKRDLDRQIDRAESGFEQLVERAGIWYRNQLIAMSLLFTLITLLMGLLSLVISSRIARRITRPLEDLTDHITDFVDSQFTLETDLKLRMDGKDEIGRLTRNFSHLRDEVINRMKYFREKVDERTAELASANKRLLRLSEANSRFVPDEFLRHLDKASIEDVNLGDHVARNMTVLFADIRNFTRISEVMTPQENFDFINTYLSGIVPIIQENGGFIDKFIGDSVMALFPDQPDSAVRACFGILDYLDEFNQNRMAQGYSRMEIGCGLHTGSLILGTIGHENRLETTVISDAVNTAARIESLTKKYGSPVLITGETLQKLEDAGTFTYRFIDRLRVKGKQKWVSVYEFLPPSDIAKRKYQPQYLQAVAFLRSGDVKEAYRQFESLYACYPSDLAIARLKERCARFLNGDVGALEGIVQEAGRPNLMF
jgi:class 3 adenylate cyclase/HAMP domain-containing protein